MFKTSAASRLLSILALATIIVGSTAGYLALQSTGKQIEASVGWLTGWGYRKSHIINAASGAGTNYQVRIVAHYGSGNDNNSDVYLNSHCRTDFGDVRFTSSDGITPLYYWMESKVDSNSAAFWVKVADDLSTVAATIYVYYGKADATTTSNFDNTFIFGDPFDSATLNTNRWTSVDGNPTYTINTANHYLEVTDMDASQWDTGKGFHSKTITLPDTWIIEDAYDNTNGIYIYEATSVVTEENRGIYSLHHTSWSSTDYGIALVFLGDAWIATQGYQLDIGVGGNTDYERYTKTGVASYTAYWIAKKTGGTIVISDSGTQRVSEANSEVPSIFHLGIGRYSTYAFGTQRFGAFKIRKYVSPEPSHGSWGSEEVPNSAPYAPTLSSPAAGDRFNPSSSVTFSWTFSDPEAGDYQTAYQFQLDNDSDFSSPIIDSNKVSSAIQQTTQTLPSTVGLYYWRVKTWDSKDADGPYSAGRAIIVDRIKITACGILNNVVDTRTGGAVWYTAVYESDSTPFTSTCGTLNLNSSAMVWATDRWTYAFPYQMSGSQAVFTITSVAESTYRLTGLNNAAGDIVLNWATMEITINKP